MTSYSPELDGLDRFSGLVAVVALVSIVVGAVAVRLDAPQSPVSASEALDRVNPYPPSESASEANVGGKTAAPVLNDVTSDDLHGLRVAKATWIVAHLYPTSGFGPYVHVLVREHERLEREEGDAMAGFGAAWWWSLVYGGANFGLRVGASAPGNCAGPMDVKAFPLVLDPVSNIRHHCAEMATFYRRGVRGIALCEHVFYPAAPRDWGGGRFRRTENLPYTPRYEVADDGIPVPDPTADTSYLQMEFPNLRAAIWRQNMPIWK